MKKSPTSSETTPTFTTPDNVSYLPIPRQLTAEQVSYWEEHLEYAERAREYALRMLGRLPVEQGLEG